MGDLTVRREWFPFADDHPNSRLTYNRFADIIGITVHWIDADFNLHQELLAFDRLHDHHTGENMAGLVLEVLGNYDIADKLFCITTDNAGNNGTLCESLERMLEELGVLWDHKVNSC